MIDAVQVTNIGVPFNDLPRYLDNGEWWNRVAPHPPAPWPFAAMDMWAAEYWRQHSTPPFKRNARRYGR